MKSKTSAKSRYAIGLTGSMGAGKSSVLKILGQSIPVTDCDQINARLLEKEGKGWKALQKNGLLFLDETGELDRKAMADAMFEDPKTRKQIEGILHALILEEMDAWIAGQQGLCAVEVPLLFECDLEGHFDETWTVACSYETALQRLESGRHIAREEARRRLALQMAPEEKISRADKVVYNDGSQDELQTQVRTLLEQAKKEAEKM